MHNRENQQKVRSFESSLEFQQLCEFWCFLRWGEHRTKLGDDVKRYMGYVRCDIGIWYLWRDTKCAVVCKRPGLQREVGLQIQIRESAAHDGPKPRHSPRRHTDEGMRDQQPQAALKREKNTKWDWREIDKEVGKKGYFEKYLLCQKWIRWEQGHDHGVWQYRVYMRCWQVLSWIGESMGHW